MWIDNLPVVWKTGVFPASLLLLTAVYSKGIQADSTMDEAQIKQAVQAELKRLIEEEGYLDRAIEEGIESYVAKQRALARENRQGASAAKARNVRRISGDDHLYGNRQAEITLVEYSDFECPFCKRFHPTAKQLVDGSDGRVNWVYRHFPLEFHNPGAQQQAEASECAAKLGGDDAFWHYSDLIYQRTTSNGNGFPIDKLVPLATEIGLDETLFRQCLESGEMEARVKADYENGVVSGINGTPGNILLHNASGNVLSMPGALPLQRLQAGVESLLNENSDK